MSNAGSDAEDWAAQWLAQRGLTVVARNYRCRAGELDIIASDQRSLIFIEVRLRSHPGFGGAAASVTPAKQRRLLRAAQHFLSTHPLWADMPCRFDVIALDAPQSMPTQARWIRAAFTA